MFDDDVDNTKIQDLNITNEDILHLYNGLDLSRNVGIQHDNEDQHNHFGGPAVNKEDPEEELEDQAEDGIRDPCRSRGLGDVYKRQHQNRQWIRRLRR